MNHTLFVYIPLGTGESPRFSSGGLHMGREADLLIMYQHYTMEDGRKSIAERNF